MSVTLTITQKSFFIDVMKQKMYVSVCCQSVSGDAASNTAVDVVNRTDRGKAVSDFGQLASLVSSGLLYTELDQR